MIDSLFDTLDGYIVEILYGLVLTYGGIVVRVFFKDKQAQDNLHKALESGVDTVTDLLAEAITKGEAPDVDGLIGEVVDYVRSSVPEAVARIPQANVDQLIKMARGKLNLRVVALQNALL